MAWSSGELEHHIGDCLDRIDRFVRGVGLTLWEIAKGNSSGML